MQKKIKYIAGVSTATVAGFCLTAALVTDRNIESYSTAVQSSSFSSGALVDHSPVQKVTPEIKREIEEAGLIYEEKTNEEERQALNDLKVATAESYGQEFGLDAEEAAKRLERQIPLSDAIQSIVTTLTEDEIAGWGVDHESDQVGWVAVTDGAEVSKEAQQILSANPDIEMRTAQHSYKALQAAQSQLTESISTELQSGFSSQLNDLLVHSDIDMDKNQLVIGLDKDADVFSDQASRDDMLAAARSYFAQQSDIPVDIVLAPAASSSMAAPLTGGASFLGGCTTGFAVKRKNGKFGMVTAGHCPNFSIGRAGGKLDFVVDHFTGQYDIQLHQANRGAKVSPYFAYDKGAKKLVKAKKTMARNKMKGLWTCYYGILSGRSCGTIKSLNYRPTGPDYPASKKFNFVRIGGKKLRGCGGDSGGPVFIGSTALGTISGGVSDRPSYDCKSISNGPLPSTFFASINENLRKVNSSLLTK